jgi:iron complex transport system substrate-binding protein
LAFARGSERIFRVLAAAGLVLAAATPLRAEAPGRVVSMNLCTDQLALMLAREGQLISVSDIARDPLTSAMHLEAAAYPVNHGGAEEIFLLEPDLVLAGVWTDPATVAMLRGLGIEVAQIDVANSLADIPDLVRQVGRLLDRETEAEALVSGFETDLARLAGHVDGEVPRAAFYYPNGYTLGTGTLSHDIVTHVGFDHIAEELGRDTSGRVALELMVLAAPDLVIGAAPYPGASRSEEILSHPALRSLTEAAHGAVSGPDWICGTPHVVRALAEMADIRAEIEAGR